MYICYKQENTINHFNVISKVAPDYIKYLLKNVVDVVEANGHTVTLKGSRVYVNGKASTWGVFLSQVGE